MTPQSISSHDYAALVRVIRRAAQRGRELREMHEGQAAKVRMTIEKNTDLPQPEAKNALD